MAIQTTDIFIVQRSGTQYQMTADQIADFVGAIKDYSVADIVARDALSNLNIGDRVFVTDATADATVDAGWAVYRVQSTGPNVFEKIQEQESLDIAISGSDLSYTPAPGQGTIVNSGGNNAVIPLASSINAGLMPPAAFDAVHDAATAGLTPGTNPINVAGNQQITFDIAQLDPLP